MGTFVLERELDGCGLWQHGALPPTPQHPACTLDGLSPAGPPPVGKLFCGLWPRLPVPPMSSAPAFSLGGPTGLAPGATIW